MRLAQYWSRISHLDREAVLMADRHYSRQTPGSKEFTRPGNKIVLARFNEEFRIVAIWASQRPAPGKAVRADGLDAWDCSLFRNEQTLVKASELIREAEAITLGEWGMPPRDGFVTTIDPAKVEPTMQRGSPIWGWCFVKAGWSYLHITKERKLIMYQRPHLQLAMSEPLKALDDPRQLRLLETA